MVELLESPPGNSLLANGSSSLGTALYSIDPGRLGQVLLPGLVPDGTRPAALPPGAVAARSGSLGSCLKGGTTCPHAHSRLKLVRHSVSGEASLLPELGHN